MLIVVSLSWVTKILVRFFKTLSCWDFFHLKYLYVKMETFYRNVCSYVQ